MASPFSAVNQELGSFLQELDAFEQLIELVGTPSDGPDLQSQLGVRKSNLEYMQQRIELQLAGLAGYGDRDELDKVHRKLNNASNAHRMLLDSLASKEAQANYRGAGPYPPAYYMPSPAANPQFQHFEQPAYPPLEPPAQQQQQHDEHMQMQMQMQMEQQQHDANALEIDGLKLEARDAVYWDTLEVEHRNAEMQQISQDLVVLQEVFKDAAQEVELQGEQLEVADTATEEAKVNTKSAVKSLGKSSKNAKKVVLPAGGALGGAVIGGVTGAIAFGPIGALVGAGIGAGCGAVAGAGTGKVLQLNTDKTMHKARLNEAWQPDKSVSNCTACNRKFTATFRKHHCRNCGFIFCQKCTKKKINLPGVESEGRQIVCDKCYNEIVYATADAALGAAPPGMAMSPPLPGKPLPPLPTSSSSSPSLSPYSSPPMTPTYGGGSQPLPSPPPRPTAPKPAF